MNRFKLLLVIVLGLSLHSCKMYNDILFQDTKDFEFTPTVDAFTKDYQIAENDKITFRLYTKDGLQLIDPIVLENGGAQMLRQLQESGINFLVESDGNINLPLLGRVKIVGKTLIEAEQYLEKEYARYFNNPYAVLDIINNRVIVSTGGGSSATVINLVNNNTTVLEAIAMAGGLSDGANAQKIKLIRKEGQERVVYKVDLSTLEGLEMADMVVQANDIVYVEPNRRYVRDIATELGPYLTLLSSALLIYGLLTNGL